jgi:hypothetical protein
MTVPQIPVARDDGAEVDRAGLPATPTTCAITPYAVLAPTTSGRALIRSSPNSCAIAAHHPQAMSPYVRTHRS